MAPRLPAGRDEPPGGHQGSRSREVTLTFRLKHPAREVAPSHGEPPAALGEGHLPGWGRNSAASRLWAGPAGLTVSQRLVVEAGGHGEAARWRPAAVPELPCPALLLLLWFLAGQRQSWWPQGKQGEPHSEPERQGKGKRLLCHPQIPLGAGSVTHGVDRTTLANSAGTGCPPKCAAAPARG